MRRTDTYKTAKTLREYRINWSACGGLRYDITVPTGSMVSNQTALGCDDDYRFLTCFDTMQLVGFKAPMLAHDLSHYGLNIPAEYCEPYRK